MGNEQTKVPTRKSSAPAIKITSKFRSNEIEIVRRVQMEMDNFKERWEKPSASNAQLDDFERIRTLGTGAFGRVMLVQHIVNKNYFAMKILDKLKVKKLKQVKHTLNEKRMLAALKFPFIVGLIYHFKDNTNLYMVMDYIMGGELFTRVVKAGKLKENEAKFYASQIILAFYYLHSMDIAHRDLKLENVLLGKDGYLKLVDFGFAKKIKGRTWTLCGTPGYIAPEIILSKGYNKSVDWWAFGVLLFEMTAGYPPFYDRDHIKLYKKILSCSVRYPNFISSHLKDLLKRLLQVDLTRRFGNLKDGIRDITTHKWFDSVDWLAIYQKTAKVPYLPACKGPGDDTNYDNYEEEPLLIAEEEQCPEEFAEF